MAINAQSSDPREVAISSVSFEQQSDTLLLHDVPLRIDTQMGDEELGVSLLIESLEQEYRDMILEGCDEDDMLSLQNAKEWVTEQPGKIIGLFHYLRNLSCDQ